MSKGSRGARDLPLVRCTQLKDCRLLLELPAVDWWGETLALRPPRDQPFSTGYLALMTFCGSGALLAGPWPLKHQIAIGEDNAFQALPAGVYEVCYCSPVQVGDSAIACVDGKEFGYLRGLLQIDSSKEQCNASLSTGIGGTATRATLPEVSLRPLQSFAAVSNLDLWIEPHPNELSGELVFCRVGGDKLTNDSCKFTVHSEAPSERPLVLSIVPVKEDQADSAAVCSRPGVTMRVSVNGKTEVQVTPFLPTSFKYAICGNGSILGTLIVSGGL